ncbi:MAG: cadherin-like domain-containing protein, partial [Sulfurovaceae bacterium]|nr:cadherin-like domain-containing protein [Sulfurovaceae bacterium]
VSGSSYPVVDGSTFSLESTDITYGKTITSGSSAYVYGYEAGLQGDALRFHSSSSDETAYDEFSLNFSSPIRDAQWKMTDFDEEEIVTIKIFDENGDIYDLSTVGVISVGSRIKQSGNTFIEQTSCSCVDGDDPKYDNEGSIIFDFTGLRISKIIVSFNAPHGTLRMTEIHFPCHVKLDTDGDSIFNHLDLDSDNDGIPDNVEAQTTNGYKAPSGSVDKNGTYSAIYGEDGIIPVDTDEDNLTDMLDSDSDNDGESDCAENRDSNSTCPVTKDMVGTNGLVSWAEKADDYIDVNGLAHDGSVFKLDDSDNDTLANGSDANATTKDLDYRDNVVPVNNPPVAVDSNYTIDTRSTQILDLESLLTDPDTGDTLSILSINDVNLTGSEQNITVPNGQVQIDKNGVMTFVPNAGFTGNITFPYEGTDGIDKVVANINIKVTTDTDG